MDRYPELDSLLVLMSFADVMLKNKISPHMHGWWLAVLVFCMCVEVVASEKDLQERLWEKEVAACGVPQVNLYHLGKEPEDVNSEALGSNVDVALVHWLTYLGYKES